MSSTNIEKHVTTKDIANLYTDLQTMIDKVPKSPRLERERSLQDRFKPSSSTPLSSASSKKASPRRDCPCRHIFVSKESEYCALCDEKIPMLVEIQNDREHKSKQIQELQEKLDEEQDLVKKYQEDIQVLNKRMEHHAAATAQTQEERDILKKDLAVLEQKLVLEKKQADDAKQAKIALENELEDLSQKLFEEANGMVANEKRAKHALEVRYNQVQEELKLCRAQIETDELQLKELKLKLGDEQSNHSSHGSVYNEETEVDKRATKDLTGLFKTPIKEEGLGDELVFNEFKEFVEMGDSTPIHKLNTSTSYMKNSLVEDVEPCLRFGPQSRLSARKLCDAILMNSCFIEEAPYGYAQDQAKRPSETPLKISASKNMIWERISSVPSSELFCQACGRNTQELPYRFRISMIDDWGCIDRYCRDRMVSVCEFYVFVRNIRQGYYNGRTIPDLFQESLRLKLQMFYAR